MKKYKKAIVIARMQILHEGHEALMRKAFEVADEVYIFIGSANSPRTIVNPFTYEERRQMVYDVLHSALGIGDSTNWYDIFPLNDILDDNNAWVKQIVDIVGTPVQTPILGVDKFPKSDIAIVGGAKNEWYIPLLTNIGFDQVKVPAFQAPIIDFSKGLSMSDSADLNATDLRRAYYTGYYDDANKVLSKMVSPAVYQFLMKYRNEPFYGYINGWYWRKKEDNEKYGLGPFCACDNLIEQDGKVLLVKRKNHPGKGLFAIPGGYLNIDETFESGAFRELKEETTASLTIEEFRNYCVNTQIFDSVHRSPHCRIITSVRHIILPSDFLLEIKAADDAAEAKMFTFEEIKEMHHLMHDDHYYLIKKLTGFGSIIRFDSKISTDDEFHKGLNSFLDKILGEK